jgi:hypothetical protein
VIPEIQLKLTFEKLVAAGIQIVPAEITSHFILERDGFVSFVERRENAFGNIGTPGLMTERGFAALIWRGDQAVFVGKGFELPATPEQVQKIRAFATDLANALSASAPSRSKLIGGNEP